MLKKLSSLIVLGGVCLSLISCHKDDAAPARFDVDTVNIEIISTGQLSTGETPTVAIIANKGYSIVSDADWLSVDKPHGNASATVTVLAQEYDHGQSRTGHLTVASAEFSQQITVRQTSDPFPAFGYIYYEDDFSWVTPYAEALGAGDYIATADPGASAPNVGSKAEAGDVDAVAFMAEFDENLKERREKAARLLAALKSAAKEKRLAMRLVTEYTLIRRDTAGHTVRTACRLMTADRTKPLRLLQTADRQMPDGASAVHLNVWPMPGFETGDSLIIASYAGCNAYGYSPTAAKTQAFKGAARGNG